MDDETAEIELLEQNLNKTHQIAQRMTTTLNGFDTRLAKLEKAIMPLYNISQILNRRANNIEKALIKIDDVASSREGIEAEEALILRGPQPGQLDVYKDALERLNAQVAFGGDDPDARDSARLVETGVKKLAQLYTKIAAEGSSGAAPPPGSELRSAPFSDHLLDAIYPVVDFLRRMPLPSTHPSHPAAPAILSTLKESLKGYADMRGTWCVKCQEGLGKRVLDRAETIDPIVSGKDFGNWANSLLSFSQREYELITELAPMNNSSLVQSSYGTLLNPILALFSNNLTSLIAFVKRSLHKYSFLALAAYDTLLEQQADWEQVLSFRGSTKESNEFRDGLQALRSVSLRSFPEFLADVKLASMPKAGGDTTTGLMDFVISTVKYMGQLPEVLGAAGDALKQVGDGNWKMGEGKAVTKGKAGTSDDPKVILEHYVYDIVSTAAASLNTLSKTKRSTFGAVFLLNNVAYLRRNILLEPAHDDLYKLLSKPTKEVLNSNFRTAKAAYFDANFSPLMQALTDDPKEKLGKAATKEKFTRFYDLLEEVVERHKLARVLEDDPEGRESIGEDVIKLVVPSLQRFTQKHREKEFSKNPQKYIKLSSDEVEAQLKGIYR